MSSTRTYLDLRELADEQRDLREQHIAVLSGDTGATPLDDDQLAYLEALSDLAIELGSRTGDLDDVTGEEDTLIPESEWVDYAQQLADDLGIVDAGSAIYPYVDWEAWANDLRHDYSSIEFDGITYYRRG